MSVFDPKKRVTPEPGQESVWDYPRPPALERTSRTIRVVSRGVTIAQSNEARTRNESPPRVLPTSRRCGESGA